MTKTIQKELEEIFSNSKDAIQKAAIDQINSSIRDNISWSVKNEVENLTAEFIKEIKPEIQESLKSNKEILIKAINKGILDSITILAEKMTANAAKNIEYDYNADKIISYLIKN